MRTDYTSPMSSEKNLKLINFFAFFAGSWFFIPILLPYCQDHIGVGYRELMFSEAIFAATCVLLDVPTGWVSDVWRRKNTLALGAAMVFVGEGILLFASSFWHLIFSQVLMGVGISLFNGTHTALLYDTLLSLGRTEEYRRREGKRQALTLYGIAVAGTIGGFVYDANPFLPIVFSMIAIAIVFAVSCAMREPERHCQIGAKTPIRDILKTFKYVLRGHEEVGLVILLAAVLFSSTKGISWTQQPYYLALGIPKAYYGVLMALGWGLGGASSHMAHLLDGKINNFRALFAAWGLAILVCLGAGSHLGSSGVVLLMFGGSCIYGATSPRVNEIINKSADSSRRATLLSTQTFSASVLFVPVCSLIGWVADKQGIQTAHFFIAAWLGVLGIGLFLLKRSHALRMLKF